MPTPPPPPPQVADVTFGNSYQSGYPMTVYMSTATAGATIFYSTGPPTHNGPYPGSNTYIYDQNHPPTGPACRPDVHFEAIAYEEGYLDSNNTVFDGDNSCGPPYQFAPPPTPTIPPILGSTLAATGTSSTTTAPAAPTTLYFQYTYDAASNETSRYSALNNVTQIYTPDALNRMGSRQVMSNTAQISFEHYGYDPMSRITGVTRDEDAKSDRFGYDYSGQLTSASYQWNNRGVGYGLDNVGNRHSVNDAGSVTNYTPNAAYLNQYTNAGGPITNGNEHEITGYQGITYAYYGDTRLQSVTGGGNTYNLYYDALGRCVKRTLNGTSTYYVYDGEKPIVEYKANGTIAGKNLYGKGIDEILMRSDYVISPGGQGYFYQQDHEGSVTHLTGFNGQVIESYRYDAFGAPTTTASLGSFNNRFKFTGREWNATFGFYEYRNRAYHPGLGRFMSEDPKGFDAGDYNLYRYGGNDPVDKTDPMGLYAFGPEFNEAQRQQLERQQKNETQKLESAASRIDHALEAGKQSKEFKSLSKDFQKVFHKEATPDNLSKVSQTAQKMITALRDDGSKGYVAHPFHADDVKRNGWPEGTFGRGTLNGKTIWINVDHPLFKNPFALRWDIGHESAHNAGVGDHAYRHQTEKYQNLTPEERLDNADSYMDFVNH